MFTKKFGKVTIAALVALSVFFIGGLSQLAAFSVDLKKIYYLDPSNPRIINYDFSAGSPPVSNTITIPDNFVQKSIAEAGLSYTFGPYPAGPGETNDIQVALDIGGGKATLTSATEGGVIISTAPTLPDLRSAHTQWVYSVHMENFRDLTDPEKEYRAQIGFGSPMPGPHPEFTVAWIPTPAGRSLMLEAAIFDDSAQASQGKVWSSPPVNVTLPGLTPETASLTLRLRRLYPATNGNMVFDYSIDGGQTWAPVGTFEIPMPIPDPFPHMSFPAKFPYVALSTGSGPGPGGHDPFQVYSYHRSDGYFYGLFIDDPGQQLYQDPVTVESTDLLLDPTPLVFSFGQWRLPQEAAPINFLGMDKPTTLPTFVFKATKKTGEIEEKSKDITGYVEEFVTVTSPGASVSTPPTFTWTWPGTPAPDWYGVSVFDFTANMPVMNVFNLPGNTTSVPYSGQPLVPGRVYHYTITAGFQANSSFTEGDFAFGGGSGGEVTISYSGNVKRQSDNTPVSGAIVELEGSSPLISTTTAYDGNFTLTGLPFNMPFSIKITRPPTTFDPTNYVPAYSKVLQSANNFSAQGSYNLFTPDNLINWGVSPGRGAIRGGVVDGANPDGFIAGAVVTYTSALGHTDYIVKYRDGSGNPADGNGTRANGGFFILNVMEGDTVTVNASQPNFTFPKPIVFNTHDGAVSQGRIHGNLMAGKVALSGHIMDKNNLFGIGGALVERVGANSTTSLNDGLYNLIVPVGTPFYLKFSKAADTTLVPTYTAEMAFTQDHVNIGDNNLFTTAQLTAWNVTPGKGVIRGRVRDQAGNSLGGATVTAVGTGKTYQVTYQDDAGAFGGQATYGNGRYYVIDVDDGDTVTITAQKTGWAFVERIFHAYADSVHQGGIKGEVGTLPANNLLQNGRFDNDMAGWFVNPALAPWNPRLADGIIALHPPQYGFMGTILYQNLNITNIAGKTINLFLSLTANNSMYYGKTIAVYLHYLDNNNVLQKVKIFNPENKDIGPNTTFSAPYTFPATARKLVRFEIVKEDFGELFADNISLAADGVTVGVLPTITGISATSGAYGSQLTITGTNFGTVVGRVLLDGSPAGIQINNWSNTSITITLQEPARSGMVSVEADFSGSNIDAFFKIVSPYFTIDNVTRRVQAVKGEIAEFTLRTEFFNGFSSTSGISFSVDNAALAPLSTFTPGLLNGPGGTLLKINTASLAPGIYRAQVKSSEASSLPRTTFLELEVITVADIVFLEFGQPITSKTVDVQGPIYGIYAEARDAGGNPIFGNNPFALIEMQSNHPSLSVYKRSFGYELYALSAGTATLTARTADGLSRDLTVTISIPEPPLVTVSLNPGEVSNLRQDPITFSAFGTTPLDWIGYDNSGMPNFQADFLDKLNRAADQLSASSSFNLTQTPAPLGTVLFHAQSGTAKAVAPLRIVNDPSMSAVRVTSKSLDGGNIMIASEHFTLNFYGEGSNTPAFTRDVFAMHGGGAGGILVGAITPGTYKIEYIPGSPDLLPQWWPNAEDQGAAEPVTFAAGQTVDNIVFFLHSRPSLVFTGSVRDALINYPNTPISDATVKVLSNVPNLNVPTVKTDIDGNFTVTGLPQGVDFSLEITKPGFRPVYSADFKWFHDINALLPFGMFPETQFAAWGNDTTKGIILGRVTQAHNPAGYLAGATVTAVDFATKAPYPVTYANSTDTTTGADGFFYVKNVPDGVTVELSASLPGWQFAFPPNPPMDILTNWVTVHAGAVSEQSFFAMRPPVSYMGQVTDKDGMPLGGAKVELSGSTAVSPATSDPGGNFTLYDIPVGENFHLKISKDGFLTTYSSNRQAQQGNIMAIRGSFALFTVAQVSKWGVTLPDTGVIHGRVFDMQDPMRSNVGGVVVTAMGMNKTYPVTYQDDAGVFGGQATYGNGKYFVLNVDDGDTVTVTAQKSGWSFSARNFMTHAGGVSQGGVPGARQLLLGKWGYISLGQGIWGWQTESTLVTFNNDGASGTFEIYSNDNGVLSHNTSDFTYTLAANPDGSFNMMIMEPGEPPEPPMRLILSEDGNMGLIDSTMSQEQRLEMIVKLDAAKAYSNADLSGEYYGVDYGHANALPPNGSNMAVSNITQFSAATGTFTSVARGNIDGLLQIDDQSATPRPYAVNPNGSVSLREGKLIGYVSGNVAIASGPHVTGVNPWTAHIFMKKNERPYATADLAGAWAYASFGDFSGTTFRSEFGGFTCDAAGKCDFNVKVVRSDGSVTFIPVTQTFTVSEDGSFGPAPGPPGPAVPVGKIGNNGKTILLNRSFDISNLQDRSIIVAIKVKDIQNVAGAKYHVWAGTHHDAVSGNYFGNFVVNDPGRLLTSVTLTVPGIATPINLTYRPDTGAWWTVPQLHLGASPPDGTDATYTLTLTDSAMNTTTVQKTLSGGVAEFATNLAPTGNVTGPIDFTFTGITGGEGYLVHLFEAGSNNTVWISEKVPPPAVINEISIPYGGPPLQTGSYYYLVHSWIGDNSSFVRGDFSYSVPQPFAPGDVDHSHSIDLADVILSLQAAMGTVPAPVFLDADVNRDGMIGIPEAIYGTQVIAELREASLSPLEEAKAGIMRTMGLFKDTWNAQGINGNYLPLYHPAYLDDGLDRTYAVQHDLPEPSMVIVSFDFTRVLFFDQAKKIITVEGEYSGTMDGFTQGGTLVETFGYNPATGNWLFYGNQRLGEFSVWPGTNRTIRSNGAVSDKTVLHLHLEAKPDTVAQVALSGPGLAGTMVFPKRGTVVKDGITYDYFTQSQGSQDVEISTTPAVGDEYTFTVTKMDNSTVVYKQTIRNVRLGAPFITSPKGHALSDANIGAPLNVTWTLPDPGISMDDVHFSGQVCHANGCEAPVDGEVTSPTGGTINLPLPTSGSATSAYIDVRVHYLDEVFMSSRFEFK